MAWIRDCEADSPRLIFELDEQQRGARCNCECVSCGTPLDAVNAARDTFQLRPHFRHPEGTPRHSCVETTARMALLHELEILFQADVATPK
ncbi:hypothetical protein [Burkholderia sp. lig30]|jgi:hypothetical protein|uniref:hypothetical protein n=1 Tax=Burkholderia sp. lig30 TaxID=1192124 RepID=UPI00057265A4|nr:hypothetical protein [Burkholderia sp. lig30]